MPASQPDQAALSCVPLSWAQEQLWFIDGFHDGFPAHNLAYLIRLAGPLDAAALGRALDAVVARHEPLRTRLAAGEAGRPVQLIDPPAPVALAHDDLTGLDPVSAAERLREIAAADAVAPFRLERDWPLRARLVALPDDEHALIVIAHQTAFDDASLGVLQRDLATLYAATANPRPAEGEADDAPAQHAPDDALANPAPDDALAQHGPDDAPANPEPARDAALAPLPLTFASHAADERARLAGQTLAALEDFWRTTLAGQPSSQFPADRPRPLLANHQGATEAITISAAVDNQLRQLADRTGATLAQVLMTALQVLLYRYTGQRDVVTGFLDGGRQPGQPVGDLIGLLGGPLPVRADLSGDPSLRQFLVRVRGSAERVARHAGLPFARLVESLNLERDPGRFPVFQTGLGYSELPAGIEAAGVTFRCEALPVAASRYDISFAVRACEGGGLRAEATYTPALFDTATVRRLLGNFAVLLGGIAADPDVRLSALPIMTGAELHDELIGWNDTARPFPVICIHQGFEAQAARAPEAIAARYEDEQVSYCALNRQANQIARALRAHGVGPEVLTGVCLPTGIRRLAALLGVWKAGGGYVPLDQALPADRLAFLIGDTGMRVVLADESSAAAIPDAGATVLSLDELAPRLPEFDGGDLADTGVQPSNVAYVIYTSGSTGQPKGVVVEHRQALNFLQGMIGAWHIEPTSAVLGFAAFTFDVSVMDMFMPLLAGARIVLAPASTLHSPPRLAELIRTSKVTFACLPPAVLRLLIGEEFPDLQTLLSSGEELSSDLLKAWLRDGLEIYNGYGPTEASIGSTFMKLEPSTPLPPPIGRPKPNYQAYVLDEYLNPVPVGVTGELHVGGTGVARGYLNRPDLTEQRFIADPLRPGGRLYKTGDLVRRRPDGTIEFAGRIDNQVKIRGLRVEPGEIETAMLDHPRVAQAVVTVLTDAAGERQLAGYFRADGALSAADLRSHLAGTLPGYMIPTYLTPVATFPLGTHGKIDQAALPAPQAAASAAQRVPPRTLIETVLVDLYATVLGSEQVGATDSFFDAGGNSLQAMQLITRLRTELDVDIDVASVFVTPTPRQLAAVLRDKHGFEDEELGADGIAGLTEQELGGELTETMLTETVLTETGHAH